MEFTLFRCPLHPNTNPLPASGMCSVCGAQYSFDGGIADLLPPGSEYPDDFRARESAQWDEQAQHYEMGRATDPTYTAGVSAVARALDPHPGERILDAGCGTGLNLRRYWKPGLAVVALDLSVASLRICRAASPSADVAFVRGDLARLPFATATFDRVLCANTLQHIPGSELRRQCIRELARVAKPCARVVVSTHNYSRAKRRAGWLKENSRASGPSGEVQYIYRYDADEFRNELAAELDGVRIDGAGFPLWYRWKLSPISRRLEAVAQRVPGAERFGHMLIASCQRRRTPLPLSPATQMGLNLGVAYPNREPGCPPLVSP